MRENVSTVDILLNVTVERTASDLIQWSIVRDRTKHPDDLDWGELVHLFETSSGFSVPVDPKTVEAGQRIRFAGPATVEFSKSWTDCGYEHDVNIYWDEATMKVVHHKPRGRHAKIVRVGHIQLGPSRLSRSR